MSHWQLNVLFQTPPFGGELSPERVGCVGALRLGVTRLRSSFDLTAWGSRAL
ncbi:hypothetical protein AGABI1DRAFT_135126 [Agaricus bisporus var. burnettii JB137-S8]|uniref:Uncharacterized protein n=1 Tax=Agaricus bisporus var. burnettii (strain JB137-S8 / ATCC MYA-4627 / FGSC 10392) TaxID=597362 RepID=K5WRB0_AGABU|nr:uncharacterized protein AGABI1DRAFT_135126 [Agaricus bisporus var. burnettii JB137-S8]EKM73293.1 hypothetical protein AGABI1DRAFT_135126 [Agaricus bisporus var. burnettii JB137-S8]